MNRSKQLFQYIQAHQQEYLTALEGAVRLESPTEGDAADLAACREYFADLFQGIGFQVTTVPSLDARFADHLLMEYGPDAGRGAEELARWRETRVPGTVPRWEAPVGGTSRRLLFGGHYDTVHEKGIFGPDLWKVEDDRAVGPGVLDMKSGDVMVYMIVKAFQDLGLMPAGANIAFLLTSDEEAGSYGSSALYQALAARSRAAFIMESSVGVEGDYIGGLKCGRFGRGNYTFRAHGVPYHSGLNPTLAESGLIELAKQAVRLEQMTYFDRINPKTGQPETVTVGCTCLQSGNAGWPTVPGDGSLTIDARYSTGELAEEYDRLFRNMESFNPKVPLTTEGGIEKPPFDKDLPGNRALQETALEVGAELGVEMHPGVVRGGSDGNFTASTGCPTLDGLGTTGGHVHQLGEYINLSHLPFRLAFTAELALRVLEEGEAPAER